MGVYKDLHGKSRFGQFIKKAAQSFPEAIEILPKLATGNIVGAFDDVKDLLKGKTNEKDGSISKIANDLQMEFELKREEFAIESFRIESEDRKDARKLYSADSLIQKMLSIIFVAGYIWLSWYLLQVLMNNTDLPKLAETMITMIWTGTSTKLNTIIDFFFGGSMNKGK